MQSMLEIQKFDPVTLSAQVVDSEPLLIERIAKNNDLTVSEARELFTETIKFLILSFQSDIPVTPGLLIDEAWHEFILFTRLYADFCMQTFGVFVHHKPGGSDEENHRQFERTLILYALNYNAPPRKYWGCHGYFSNPLECGAEID